MQTCSICNASSNDTATKCSHCQADLRELSMTAVALKRFRENPRVKAIRVTCSCGFLLPLLWLDENISQGRGSSFTSCWLLQG